MADDFETRCALTREKIALEAILENLQKESDEAYQRGDMQFFKQVFDRKLEITNRLADIYRALNRKV